MRSWQATEEQVREIANVKWGTGFQPRTIGGLQIDAVRELDNRHWIALEITENDSLEKIRKDVVKLQQLFLAKSQDGIFVETYQVVNGHVTPGMRNTADSSKVKLYSVEEFAQYVLGAKDYTELRNRRPFGSAVEPDTGHVDGTRYVKIQYVDNDGKKYDIEQISTRLAAGQSVVVLGEFGTGKSRCLMECFRNLQDGPDNHFGPIAINLRDCWGLQDSSEMISRHLRDLGMSQYLDATIKSVNDGFRPIFLDGFDELASQTWDGDINALKQSRRKSLAGVRDLLSRCRTSGVMVTGREHYFQSDAEMFDCLGLNEDTLVLRCPDEFTLDEAREYLSLSGQEETDVLGWIPRKPLICQLYSKLGTEKLQELNETADDEVAFFEHSLTAICDREARIHDSIDAESVRKILLALGERTRYESASVERITERDLQDAFISVVGSQPKDTSALVLQRLPYLGRVDSQTNDRVFVDDYAKNGLRALSLVSWVNRYDGSAPSGRWRKHLSDFGLRVAARHLPGEATLKKFANACLRVDPANDQAAAETIAAHILRADDEVVDFESIQINDVHLPTLHLAEKRVRNIQFNGTFFDSLSVPGAQLEDFVLEDCHIHRLEGLSDLGDVGRAYPSWNIEVDQFVQSFISSRLSQMELSNPQKILLAILQKLFRQPGRGRKESALLRGGDKFWDQSVAKDLLKQLISEGVVSTHKGRSELVYVPIRSKNSRVEEIFRRLSKSNDVLWPS